MDVEEALAPAEERRFCEVCDIMQTLLKLRGESAKLNQNCNRVLGESVEGFL